MRSKAITWADMDEEGYADKRFQVSLGGARAIERYDEDQPSGPFNIHEDNRGKARAVLSAAFGAGAGS